MRIARAVVVAAVLAASALPLGGCCAMAVSLCGIEAPKSPPRLTRDAPGAAIDYLVDAIERRSAREVYFSLHPDFVRESGDFSLQEFLAGFERFEPEFRADAAKLRKATRSRPRYSPDGTMCRIDLAAGDASVTLVFRNRPVADVTFDDPEVGEISSEVQRLDELFAVDGEELFVTRPLPLGGQGEWVDLARLRRVSVHQDWLLHTVAQPRNIEFAERLKAVKGAQ
jgi:hypothetical protein